MANSANSGGIGFCGALTIAFIVLKLLGVIGWSWFWVFSPIIISAGFVVTFLTLALVGYCLFDR